MNLHHPHNNRLLVQVSLTEDDPPDLRAQVMKSANDFHDTLAEAVFILIIYQSESGATPPELERPPQGVRVIHSACFSVSEARNQGLDFARVHGYSHILFQDASIRYNSDFATMIRRALEENLEVCRGKAKWNKIAENDSDINLRELGRPRRKKISPIGHPYLWSYILKVDVLEGLRFDSRLGPGKESSLNAGEDTMLLAQLRDGKPNLRALYFPRAQAAHPPRPEDLSKHRSYAKAQGAIFRYLIRKKFRPRTYYLLYTALFSVVMFGRIPLCRRNSIKTAGEFLRGWRCSAAELVKDRHQ